jgi:hypothetical protein
MSLLASLVFVLAALMALGALGLTLARYGEAALANVAALRSVRTAREFRYQAVTLVARPALGVEVRRAVTRISARRRVRSLPGLRAAA